MAHASVAFQFSDSDLAEAEWGEEQVKGAMGNVEGASKLKSAFAAGSPNVVPDLAALRAEVATVVAGGRGAGPAWPTGVVELDAALGGGVPRGRVTEVVGSLGAGKTSLVRQLVARVLAEGGWVAWIDATRTLAPQDLAGLGERLIMVRPRDHTRGAWCADLLLRSGVFALVVMDGAPVLSRVVGVRLSQLARERDAAFVVLREGTQGSRLGGAVRLQLRPQLKSVVRSVAQVKMQSVVQSKMQTAVSIPMQSVVSARMQTTASAKTQIAASTQVQSVVPTKIQSVTSTKMQSAASAQPQTAAPIQMQSDAHSQNQSVLPKKMQLVQPLLQSQVPAPVQQKVQALRALTMNTITPMSSGHNKPEPQQRSYSVLVEKGGLYRTVEVTCAIVMARRVCADTEIPDRRGVARRTRPAVGIEQGHDQTQQRAVASRESVSAQSAEQLGDSSTRKSIHQSHESPAQQSDSQQPGQQSIAASTSGQQPAHAPNDAAGDDSAFRSRSNEPWKGRGRPRVAESGYGRFTRRGAARKFLQTRERDRREQQDTERNQRRDSKRESQRESQRELRRYRDAVSLGQHPSRTGGG